MDATWLHLVHKPGNSEKEPKQWPVRKIKYQNFFCWHPAYSSGAGSFSFLTLAAFAWIGFCISAGEYFSLTIYHEYLIL